MTKHEDGGERLIDQETGEAITEHMQERQPVRYIRNGSRMSGSWLLTIKNIHLIIGAIIALGTLVGLCYGATNTLVMPAMREAIREEIKPLAIEMRAGDLAFQQHVQEAAMRYGDYPRRDELTEAINDLRTEIRLLRQEMKR